MMWVLLIAFQVKHFICDYPLQTARMLAKGNADHRVWVPALAAHAAVHAAGTLAIGVSAQGGIVGPAFGLCAADFALHFIVDRIKASPSIGGRWAPNVPYFWWALGADQFAHHTINIWFTYLLVTP